MGRHQSIATFAALDFPRHPGVAGFPGRLIGLVRHHLLANSKPQIRRDKALAGGQHQRLAFQVRVLILGAVLAPVVVTSVCPYEVGGIVVDVRPLALEKLVNIQVSHGVNGITKHDADGRPGKRFAEVCPHPLLGKLSGDVVKRHLGVNIHLVHLTHERRFCRLNHQLLCMDAVNDDRLRPKSIRRSSSHFETSLTPGIPCVLHPLLNSLSLQLREYNADENVTYIDIEGSVPAIPSNKIRLCLRDTPGPNNSRDENHERLTRTIIKRTNAVVLYVMNATQIGIKDDKQLLKDISSEMKRAGKQSRDRFIFVINKCDALDEQKGETIDSLLNDVREYLKDFDIVEPTLIPTSARLALLIRKDRKGEKLSRMERQTLAQVNDFVESELLHFEKYATLTPTVREKLQKDAMEYHEDEETWDLEALIHTGIPAVEQTICEYIDKYAYPMKLKDAMKDIVGILNELDMRAKFEANIASNGDKLQRVRTQIGTAQKKHAESKKVYHDYKTKINNFKLDTLNEDHEQFEVEMELQTMLKEYDGKTKVDKVEADSLVASFQEKLEKFQRECEGKLNREIDIKIFRKCSEMLEEYSAMVSRILDDIEIEGYDFKKINSFDKIRISNINDIKKRNEQDRFRDETRWKDNPERSGFFGRFKFWKPKEISYTVSVKDGVDVNVKNIIVDIMSVFAASIKENISSMFSQSLQQIEEYKMAFYENIDTLDCKIGDMLNELEQSTRESEALEKKVKENRAMAEWIGNKEREIQTLLTF